MNKIEILKATEEFARNSMESYDSGHDWWHIERVRRLAKFINKQEKIADPFTLDIAVLLHDCADSKFADGEIEKGYLRIEHFMDKPGLTEIKDKVMEAIRNVSFSIKNPKESTNDAVLMILQDADRLDAIGAIGIARAFNYGGFRNYIMYNPDMGKSDTSTINHFYDKLLVLKFRMNTLTAKKLAVERHEFLETFLKQFYKEWGYGSSVS